MISDAHSLQPENGNKTKKWLLAWLLSIAILVIQLLAGWGIWSITHTIDQVSCKIERNIELDHAQNLIIRELQIHQNERLKREGRR